MEVIITPRALGGSIAAIPSKSHLHRLLICAALGDSPLKIPYPAGTMSGDIKATLGCLAALGSDIKPGDGCLVVGPLDRGATGVARLDCGESGSTYRFLVPVVLALGRPAVFRLSGRLPSRPMDDLFSALEVHGAKIRGKGSPDVFVSGRISHGKYEIPGNISSQYVTGLLLALPLLAGESEIIITGKPESAGYINMTLGVLRDFSVEVRQTPTGYHIPAPQKISPTRAIMPEGDWSNSAFWLAAGAMRGEGIRVTGLRRDTTQGDSAMCEILRRFGTRVEGNCDCVAVSPSRLRGISVNAADIPDLVPAIAAVAAAAEGVTVIEKAGRLRLKESDRLSSVSATLNALGGCAVTGDNSITIYGTGGLVGGKVESFADHRIAMMAAVCSVICKNNVIISNVEATDKSYPGFFSDFAALGGSVIKGD
ncbi:MAG: 3-phosphoshikimate 1-carboxyvinyltransferase [Eubacteriales bacterium]|jgi:3-phosphoshikimate 1-carboxyvinyltransferase